VRRVIMRLRLVSSARPGSGRACDEASKAICSPPPSPPLVVRPAGQGAPRAKSGSSGRSGQRGRRGSAEFRAPFRRAALLSHTASSRAPEARARALLLRIASFVERRALVVLLAQRPAARSLRGSERASEPCLSRHASSTREERAAAAALSVLACLGYDCALLPARAGSPPPSQQTREPPACAARPLRALRCLAARRRRRRHRGRAVGRLQVRAMPAREFRSSARGRRVRLGRWRGAWSSRRCRVVKVDRRADGRARRARGGRRGAAVVGQDVGHVDAREEELEGGRRGGICGASRAASARRRRARRERGTHSSVYPCPCRLLLVLRPRRALEPRRRRRQRGAPPRR